MLSVIHPSSTQQPHIGGGSFRSSNPYGGGDGAAIFGFHPAVCTSSGMSSKYMNSSQGKWPVNPQHVQTQCGWTPNTSSSASYLIRHPPHGYNTPAAAAPTPTSSSDSFQSSFKFYNTYNNPAAVTRTSSRSNNSPPTPKDYSKPLFVDCSIEYELPNAPKIPKNSEPILMIHPGYKHMQNRSVKRASSHVKSSTSSAASSSAGSAVAGRGGPLPTKSKGVKRTHSQLLSSSDVILSNEVALLQQQQQQQQLFNNSRQQSCCYVSAPQAKRCCPGLQEQAKRQQQELQQAQYYWQASNGCQTRCGNSYSPADYWLPPTSSAALAYYKAQLRMRQQESFLKSISQQPGFCMDCVQGKCSQVAWNKENLGFMRSL